MYRNVIECFSSSRAFYSFNGQTYVDSSTVGARLCLAHFFRHTPMIGESRASSMNDPNQIALCASLPGTKVSETYETRVRTLICAHFGAQFVLNPAYRFGCPETRANAYFAVLCTVGTTSGKLGSTGRIPPILSTTLPILPYVAQTSTRMGDIQRVCVLGSVVVMRH